MSRIDPHSYYDDAQPRLVRLDLDLTADFVAQRLHGTAVLQFDRGGAPVDLDTRGLDIERITGDSGVTLSHTLAAEEPILGSRLHLELPAGTGRITITYRTSPQASGLQWLEPSQTASGRQPFLFSQCQAIHARSVVPVQDTACVRFPYGARLTVPAELTAVMSAGPGAVQSHASGRRTFQFEMPHPIPAYLLALAAGELESRDLSPRARVWAEPTVVDAAAWEFAGVEGMIATAEKLFGPYDWTRYDMLVLPASFPYGGMENPCMTFLTPTLLAGDRSLVDVVAHELAHSWTGNLVTNATAEHFWLNEGWTMWAERRILEALHGRDTALLSWALGEASLRQSIERFGADSPLTKLRTHLTGIDPDDAFSTVPYEKGARLIALLEQATGRERFDGFVRTYMQRFRFGSITTEQFLAFVEQELPGVAAQVGAAEWIDAPGIPANAPLFGAPVLDEIDTEVATWRETGRWGRVAREGSAVELQILLQRIPRPLDLARCAALDKDLRLTPQGNAEILCEWLVIAARSGYEPAFPRLREFLGAVGRMKYLRPLYQALASTPNTKQFALEVFAAAAPRYHGIARRMVQGLLA